MPQVLVRDIDRVTLRRLKARARQRRRSLEAELRDILEQAAAASAIDVAGAVKRVRRMFAGRRFSDSARLVRRDRSR